LKKRNKLITQATVIVEIRPACGFVEEGHGSSTKAGVREGNSMKPLSTI
jgi:hypothetical protein